MRQEINVQRINIELAALEPLVDAWPTQAPGECPFLIRVGRAVMQFRASLKEAVAMRRTEAQLAALDDHLLEDIGLTRAEASGWGPMGECIRFDRRSRSSRRRG